MAQGQRQSSNETTDGMAETVNQDLFGTEQIYNPHEEDLADHIPPTLQDLTITELTDALQVHQAPTSQRRTSQREVLDLGSTNKPGYTDMYDHP